MHCAQGVAKGSYKQIKDTIRIEKKGLSMIIHASDIMRTLFFFLPMKSRETTRTMRRAFLLCLVCVLSLVILFLFTPSMDVTDRQSLFHFLLSVSLFALFPLDASFFDA